MPPSAVSPSAVAAKCLSRISKEIAAFRAQPPEFAPYVHVADDDLRNVHVLMQGVPDSPYWGGRYVVNVVLPATYPFAPPDIRMMTPSGRFTVGAKICATFTSFHPETWSQNYTLSTIMASMVSFMNEEAGGNGGITALGKDAESVAIALKQLNHTRRHYAVESRQYNSRHGYDAMFAEAAEAEAAEAEAAEAEAAEGAVEVEEAGPS